MVAGMPPELAEHPFLGVRNAGKWVNLQQYELFIRNSIGQSVSKPRSVTAAAMPALRILLIRSIFGRTSQLKPVKIEPNAEVGLPTI